jgi:hypothetical protein
MEKQQTTQDGDELAPTCLSAQLCKRLTCSSTVASTARKFFHPTGFCSTTFVLEYPAAGKANAVVSCDLQAQLVKPFFPIESFINLITSVFFLFSVTNSV